MLPSNPVLATDLDGTLLPLPQFPENQSSLETFRKLTSKLEATLIYVTGRDFPAVENALDEFDLPCPDWIVAGVGTAVLRRDSHDRFVLDDDWSDHLQSSIGMLPDRTLHDRLMQIDGISLHPAGQRSQLKFSFRADADEVERVGAAARQTIEQAGLPFDVVHSVHPLTHVGLIDVLPRGISKAFALNWWADQHNVPTSAVLYAGDSENDIPALTAGFRTIFVANGDRAIAREVYDAHQDARWLNRLYLATRPGTCGLLEGCRWFEFFPSQPSAAAYEIGATPVSIDRTHFRVWAPRRKSVVVETRSDPPVRFPLKADDGHFCGTVPGVGPGTNYRLALDSQTARPDPASRYQPASVHGPSQVVHPNSFPWQDSDWTGIDTADLIVYELHIGLFTEAGTFQAAIARIGDLQQLGVTAVELMPVAQSPGKWNWGYDGVNLFAVRNTFGTPDDFKAFVDACHRSGIAVLLDVVYNHVGPEGNYLAEFAPYFSRKHHTPWGDAFDFDGQEAAAVRSFIVRNVLFWLDEYHLDGLRLDAIHFMKDESDYPIQQEIRDAVSQWQQTAGRQVHLIGEANVYDHNLLAGSPGDPYDAIWCDDIMHSIYSLAAPGVSLTYRHYDGAADVAESLRHGFLYTGPEVARITDKDRGELFPDARRDYIHSLIVALQTHDVVGNHPHGKRVHQLASVDFQKTAAALVLLYPAVPMIFMGEECAAPSPFPFFVDFQDERLRQVVDQGRAAEYPQHVWKGAISPSDPRAFQLAKQTSLHEGDAGTFAWYRELIAIRKQWRASGWLSAEHLTVECDERKSLFSLRYRTDGHSLNVHAVLAGGDRCDPVDVPCDGEILLGNASRHGASLRLKPNSAIVTKSPVTHS